MKTGYEDDWEKWNKMMYWEEIRNDQERYEKFKRELLFSRIGWTFAWSAIAVALFVGFMRW
jgi:hypothetical protein